MYRCTYYKSVYIKYITVYRLIYKPLIIQSDVTCLCFRKRWPRQGRLMLYYIPGFEQKNTRHSPIVFIPIYDIHIIHIIIIIIVIEHVF